MPFEFFDHTADLGVHISADTLDELFAAAAEAFTTAVCDVTRIDARTSEVVSLTSTGVELLLVDWLNELLCRFDARDFLVRSADVTLNREADEYRLHATLFGEPLDPDRHRIKVLIKGITYHGLTIVEAPSGWRATVVFDI